jgi:flagellar biogenesis protein FliO
LNRSPATRLAVAIALASLLLLLVPHQLPAANATQPATPTTSSISSAPQRPAITPVRDPFKDLPSYGQLLRRTAWTLLAIIAGLIVAAKLLPRWLVNKAGSFGSRSSGRMIEVVESHRLEPRKSIYLIRVAGQYFLVASTGDRLETLAGGPLDQQKIAETLRPAAAKSREEPDPGRSFVQVLRGGKP